MNDWLTAAAMLLSGLVVGFMFVYSMKRSARTGEAERRDLQAKLDARVQQLRELEDTGGSDEERSRLEGEAADALRELEGVAATQTTTTAAPAIAKKPAGPLSGFLWGAGSVAAIAALIFFVTSSAKQRGANEGLTGGQPMGAAPMQAPATGAKDPEIQRLEAAVKATPDDLALRNDLAKAQLDRENMLAVVEQTRYVLQRAPNDARALTYEGIVRVAMGQGEAALPMLERAAKNDPSILETQVALAWLYTNAGRTGEAEAAMKEAFARHPEERAKLTDVFARMKAGPQQQAPQPQQAAAAPSGPSVHVSINVPDNVRIAATSFIFVYARAAGVTSGPPAAVKRLPAAGFPIEVDLSAADSMMGQPLPEKMRIEARIDSDGNPMTKEPGDLSAFAEGVAAGANVTLSLR
jgi:cytochrome c-type biogenesis protein CcmH